jgi:type VI secretion system secreted protein Hcp
MKTSVHLLRLAALLLLTLGVAPVARGQFPLAMFLKLDSVKGSATDAAFKDQMVVLDFSYGITTSGSGSGNVQAGKATPGYLVVTKTIDMSTPVLAQAAASGTAYNQATLTVTLPQKGEQVAVYIITLNDVRVAAVAEQSNSTSPANPLTEKVSLQYASIQWAYGTTKAGYNFSTNTKAIVLDDPDTQSGGAVESQKPAVDNLQLSPLK